MIEFESPVRRWGDSLAIVVPKHIVKKENIHPKERLRVFVVKEAQLKSVYGLIAGKVKKSTAKLKAEIDSSWD